VLSSRTSNTLNALVSSEHTVKRTLLTYLGLLISVKVSWHLLKLLCKDGAALSFMFEVKFYPPDVSCLQEDVTRCVAT